MFGVQEEVAIRDNQETWQNQEYEDVVYRQLIYAENGAGQFCRSVTKGKIRVRSEINCRPKDQATRGDGKTCLFPK
jgi:hypothetical protein